MITLLLSPAKSIYVYANQQSELSTGMMEGKPTETCPGCARGVWVSGCEASPVEDSAIEGERIR